MAFDTTTRKRLSDFVADARRLLTEEFAEQLQSLYGISVTRDVAPLERLTHLDAEGLELAATLRQRIAYLASSSPAAGDATKPAIDRLTREQAFTVLNRLAAIRMAEKRGLIVESVGQQYQSKGFKVFESVAGSAIGETYDRYRCYLFCLFDELAIDLGALFDRCSPQSLLFPREKPLLALLGLLDEADLQDLWAEDETIGWIYQYYNDPAERKKMREESAAPRNSRELAVRNQFFTPRYVVEFLTDNTLGRIWYEMTQGGTTLKEQCRYLVRRPSEIFLKLGESAPEQPTQDGLSQDDLLKQPVFIPHRHLKDPRSILLLDPACGSMHFGLYAFDLFETIYDEAWEIASGSDEAAKSGELFAPFCAFAASFPDKAAFQREVPRMIVEHNLHGIDIDPRAAQIAGLSLWLRAQRAWNTAGLKAVERPRITRSNIVCAEPMPGDKVILAEFVEQQFPEGERAAFGFLLETVFDRMALAGEAGSLLKIEEEIRTAIAEAKKLWEKEPKHAQRMLFGGGDDAPGITQQRLDLSGITDEQFWEGAEDRIYAALRDYAEQAETGGFQRRLFAEDAARGFGFIDLCRKRFDVALMNPPFGESVPSCKHYFDAHYEESTSDIGMMFVSRFSQQLIAHGRLGAITNRTCLGTSQLEKWRRMVLLAKSPLSLVADLGYGVLDAAMVEACAYIVTNDTTAKSFSGFRLLDSREKGDDLEEIVIKCRDGIGDTRAQLGHHADFRELPLAVISYWSPREMLQKLTQKGRIGDLEAAANDGGHTGDDFRFVRAAWEGPSSSIGRDREYVFFAKGGEYSPMWDDIHLLEYWKLNGKEVRHIPGARIYHEDLHFTAGLTYPLRTTSDFSPRALPADCMFSTGGHGIHFRDLDESLVFLGLAYTRLAKVLVEVLFGSGDASVSGSAARNYTAGTISMLPKPDPTPELRAELAPLVKELIRKFRLGFQNDETSRYFVSPAFIEHRSAMSEGVRSHLRRDLARLKDIADGMTRLEEASFSAFGIRKDSVIQTLETVFGKHPSNYPVRDVAGDLPQLLDQDLPSLMDSAAEAFGGRNRSITKKSFFIDRTIDLLCHTLLVNPQSVCESWSISGFLPATALSEAACIALNYLVGVAFGRWDIRYAIGQQTRIQLPDPFAPLPICPPGQLQNSHGLPASPEDVPATYPLKDIPWDGILVDDPNHPLDIERRVREVIEIIWNGKGGGPTAEAIELEACDILGVKSLRDYLRKPGNLFADHLKRYSKSRRQAPIYWPLSTKSGSYTLWIYYHRLNDQTLHKCIADFLDPKIKDVEKELGKLAGKDSGRAADLRDFLNELKDLKDEIERVIKLPWKPNLNDGVLITACPLWKLFRLSKWQKDLKACWEELEKGDYDWAHLAYTIWPERVEKVCEKDRSIAIAHGLEHLCKVEPPKPKKPRGKKASS